MGLPEASVASFLTAVVPAERIDLILLRLDPETPPPRRAASLLSSEERERAERFRQPADRHRFTVGRAALRLLLAERLARAPEAFRFALSDKGRPYLEEAALDFNIAHSGGLIALAFAAGAVGVDVERVGRPADPIKFARGCFATEEIRRVERAADVARAFAHVWTAKEAVIKAEGTGVGVGLDRFAVPAASEAWQPVQEKGSDYRLDRFQVAAFDAGEGYAGAVAAARPLPVAARWMEFDEDGRLTAAPARSAGTD